MYGDFELSYREYYSGIVKGTKNGIKSKEQLFIPFCFEEYMVNPNE